MSLPIDEEQLRTEIVARSHQLSARGWVANHDGNLTARLGGGRTLATPTAVNKGDVRPEWLIVLDEAGKVISGTRKPFGELVLHRAAYAARPDIGVVLHAHPPHATAFALAGQPIGHPFLAEAVVSLGPELPQIPYRRPGSEETSRELAAALQRADVVILEGHGLLSVGGSFEQAFLRMELVEHLARLSWLARPLGGARPLPEADVRALAEKGRPASAPDWSGGAHGPASSPSLAAGAPPPSPAHRPDVRSLVEEAMRRAR